MDLQKRPCSWLVFALFQESVESCSFSDAAELNAKCFNFDEELFEVDNFLVSDQALQEDAHQSHLERE